MTVAMTHKAPSYSLKYSSSAWQCEDALSVAYKLSIVSKHPTLYKVEVAQMEQVVLCQYKAQSRFDRAMHESQSECCYLQMQTEFS